MMMQEMRRPPPAAAVAVSEILRELRQAARRPLYVELELIRQRSDDNDEQKKKNNVKDTVRRQESAAAPEVTAETASEKSAPSGTVTTRSYQSSTKTERQRVEDGCKKRSKRTWRELLERAAALLPFCADDQHGEILRLASMLLLGFLLPYSTGTDYFLLQHMKRPPTDAHGGTAIDPVEYVLQMPLEERLEKSVRELQSHEWGNDCQLTDPDLDLAFRDFVENGLATLLRNRPFSLVHETDLLHVVAMAIHPAPTTAIGPESPAAKSEHAAGQHAALLMKSLHGRQFQIRYGHRVLLVELIARHLVLPSLRDTDLPIGSLLHGAIPHVRASLRSFAATSALSHQDAFTAQCAVVSVAVQTENAAVLRDEWDFLLHRAVDDRADYHCHQCHLRLRDCTAGGSVRHPDRISVDAATISGDNVDHERHSFVCPHAARGALLSHFLVRACGQSLADQKFLKFATRSLTDIIEWQVDCWTVNNQDDDDEKDDDDDKLHAPCLLASLFLAASQLFYFQKPRPKGDGKEDHPLISLIECAVKMLRHTDSGIVKQAARLLVHAFSRSEVLEDYYAPSLLETVKVLLERDDAHLWLLEDLVCVAADQSPPFANALYELLSNKIAKDDKKDGSLPRLLLSVSQNCPAVALKEVDNLMSLLELKPSPYIAWALLCSRQARFFVTTVDKMEETIRKFASSTEIDNWEKYRLARQALSSGNFAVATEVWQQLLVAPMSEKRYLWISALEQIAVAEHSLAGKGAMGIPNAAKALHSALSRLQSIATFGADSSDVFSFQIKFLLLRLDFLDLITILRQLTREMRLTGIGPEKHTRSYLHLRNTVRCFDALASRYAELRQQHGLGFLHGQSRSSLRLLQSLAQFLAHAARAVFPDILVSKSESDSLEWRLGDHFKHPMAALMRRLDKLVVKPMDGSLDPLVRAAALLEVIDGVLLVPVPFPRDFFTPRPALSASLLLSSDPAQTFSSADGTTVETAPSLCFTVCASGQIPGALLSQSKVPVWDVLLWYRIVYNSPLGDDGRDENVTGETLTQLNRAPDISDMLPISASLSLDGKFFVDIECPPVPDEGLYTFEVSVGCRDAAGAEWEIPLSAKPPCITVRSSRSR